MIIIWATVMIDRLRIFYELTLTLIQRLRVRTAFDSDAHCAPEFMSQHRRPTTWLPYSDRF